MKSGIRRRGDRQTTGYLSLGFLVASNLVLLLYGLLPFGIGIVFLHGLGECLGLFPEVLLIHHAIVGNDECHHTGRPVFRGIRYEREPAGHFAVCDITFCPAGAIFPLASQNAVMVTAIRSRSAVPIVGVALNTGRCHQRSDGALGFAIGRLPIQAIVLPVITGDFWAYSLCCAEYSFSAATSSWKTWMVDISFRPIRLNKISCLPASVSKYHAAPLWTSGIGVGQFSAPIYNVVVPSGSFTRRCIS